MEMIWQPIETAPLDGTEVLIYEPWDETTVGGIYKASYRREMYIVSNRRGLLCWVVSHTYQDEQGGEMVIYNPTHWMPLPEPPQG